MARIEQVFDPTAPCENQPRELRRVLDSLSGKVVGFIDNTKPNFNYLVDDLADLLVSKYGVRSVVKRSKRVSSIPAPDALIKELSEECDLVITGSGD
jgi:hypothetical protein